MLGSTQREILGGEVRDSSLRGDQSGDTGIGGGSRLWRLVSGLWLLVDHVRFSGGCRIQYISLLNIGRVGSGFGRTAGVDYPYSSSLNSSICNPSSTTTTSISGILVAGDIE